MKKDIVFLNGNLRCNVEAFAHFFHHGWRMIVVQQRGHAVKAYSPEKFFMIQLPIFLAELGVALVWKLSLLLIKRHRIDSLVCAGSLQIYTTLEELKSHLCHCIKTLENNCSIP